MPVALQSVASPGAGASWTAAWPRLALRGVPGVKPEAKLQQASRTLLRADVNRCPRAQQLLNGFLFGCGVAASRCRGSRGRHAVSSRLPCSLRAVSSVSGNADHISRSVNTQDCPDVEQRPSAKLGAVESVRVQLDAIGRNDTPFRDHGVETMFAFCAGGGLTFSSGSYQDNLHKYFGYPKDLYHMDHYKGALLSSYKHLVDHNGYTIDSAEEHPDESGNSSYWVVRVSVQPSAPGTDVARFVFVVDNGRRPGVYLTERLVHAEP